MFASILQYQIYGDSLFLKPNSEKFKNLIPSKIVIFSFYSMYVI